MDPPHSSELWLDSRLLQDRIGGEAFAGRGVEREIPFRDRAVPDFMIALPVPNKCAPVRLEDALEFASEPIDHSGRDRHRALMERHQPQRVRTRATLRVDQVGIVFQQLRHHR